MTVKKKKRKIWELFLVHNASCPHLNLQRSFSEALPTDNNHYLKNDTCSALLLISTEQSPCWEANSHSASQEISRLSWDPKAHYRVYQSPMHSAHTFPPYIPKMHLNIFLPSARRSTEWSFLFRFSDQNFVCISHFSHVCYMSLSSHPPWFYHPTDIWW